MIFDVLAAIEEGNQVKTRIMCRANLSPRTGKEILSHLIDQGLIEVRKVKNRARYFRTDKNGDLLSTYRRARALKKDE